MKYFSKTPSIITNTSWLIRFNLKYLPLLTIARAIGFINNSTSRLLYSFVLGLIVDWSAQYAAGTQDPNLILYSIGAFFLCYAVTEIAATFRNYGENISSYQISYSLPLTLLHQKLNTLSTKTLESPNMQNLATRFRENKYVLHQGTRNILALFGVIIGLILAIIPLLNHIPWTVALLLIVALPNILVNKHIFKKMWDIDKSLTVSERKAGNILWWISDPGQLKEIRLIQAYDYFKKIFNKYIDTRNHLYQKLYIQWSLYDILNMILKGSVILYAIYQFIQLIQIGQISTGQIIFYITAVTQLSDLIDSLSAEGSNVYSNNLKLGEIKEFLEWNEEKPQSKKKLAKFKTPPTLSFHNVSFTYEDAKSSTLKNINCIIKPGEKVAIVGENGAGKTTLIKLLAGIYPVTSGMIEVNGENLNDFAPDSWYQNIGVLYQDFNYYSDLTAKENIALGRISEKISTEKIHDAAKKADAHDFIMDFHDKYNQTLSERYEGGTRPSSGQWQKIAIARFFYRNAPVLILDEPTAAIDAVAEAEIFDRIYSFSQNKTVIIISHRFSTVRKADRIIVLDKGEIIEEGTHEELVVKNGKYATAFKLQAKGYTS